MLSIAARHPPISLTCVHQGQPHEAPGAVVGRGGPRHGRRRGGSAVAPPIPRLRPCGTPSPGRGGVGE